MFKMSGDLFPGHYHLAISLLKVFAYMPFRKSVKRRESRKSPRRRFAFALVRGFCRFMQNGSAKKKRRRKKKRNLNSQENLDDATNRGKKSKIGASTKLGILHLAKEGKVREALSSMRRRMQNGTDIHERRAKMHAQTSLRICSSFPEVTPLVNTREERYRSRPSLSLFATYLPRADGL